MRKIFLNNQSIKLAGTLGILTFIFCTNVYAQETGTIDNSIVGDNNMTSQDTGVAVNGNVSDSNVNNNENSNQVTSITNSNPVLYAPSQTAGGNSALVLPRNPLPMPNAALGRSNFGLQFGVQNNPALSSLTGNSNAMGWFMQAGLTIPFGKIPDIVKNSSTDKMDRLREQKLRDKRDVFGHINPSNSENVAKTNVQGKVLNQTGNMDAYNYTTIPSQRVTLSGFSSKPSINIQEPKVLALLSGDIFSHPMHTGEKIGLVEAGKEYSYLGHTRSGWVKVLLPTGREGWSRTEFEYVKYDYTEIDDLTANARNNDTERKITKLARQ